MTTLIGITGFATAGKDAVADVLVRRYGFVKVAFADALREMALAIDPWIYVQTATFQTEWEWMRYSDAVARYGYGEAKNIVGVREFLQRLGTDGVRNVLGQDAWVKVWQKRVGKMGGDVRVVAADVRFENEAFAVRELGGRVWRVRRPGVAGALGHASEIEQMGIDVDEEIVNCGSLEYLESLVVARMNSERT
jgi:hypothetical protein